IAGSVLFRGDRYLAGVHSLGRSSPLIVSEEENRVLTNWPAERAAELVSIERSACWRKIISRVEVPVADKIENVAVKCVGAGFRDNVNLPPAEFAVLGIEIVGENPELGDGIEVGNDRRAHVYILFDVASVHDETVGKFPLPVDGDGARIQISRGGQHARTHILHNIGRDGG